MHASRLRLKSDPAFSLGTGQRSDIANLKERAFMPGPGNYSNMNDTVTKRQGPKYGFGTGTRDDLERSKTNLASIGPG